MMGILLNTPNIGEPAAIQTTGKSFFQVGAGGCNCGDALMCGAAGTLVKQSASFPIVGVAADNYSQYDVGAIYLDLRGGPSAGVGGFPTQMQPIRIPLSLLAGAGDKVTGIPIPTTGTLVGMHAVCDVVDNLGTSPIGYLTATNSTGGLIATMTLPVTHALCVAGGVLPQSAAPTSNTALTAGQTLKLTWVQTTTFANSTGSIWVYFDTAI